MGFHSPLIRPAIYWGKRGLGGVGTLRFPWYIDGVPCLGWRYLNLQGKQLTRSEFLPLFIGRKKERTSYGCFQKYGMFPPKSSHFNRVFHSTPSILGVFPLFLETPICWLSFRLFFYHIFSERSASSVLVVWLSSSLAKGEGNHFHYPLASVQLGIASVELGIPAKFTTFSLYKLQPRQIKKTTTTTWIITFKLY